MPKNKVLNSEVYMILSCAPLRRNRLSLILRGHECVDDGFEYPFEYLEKEGCKCILTIFSASNYNEFYNDAAYGIYERKLEFHSLPIVLDVSDDSFENNSIQQNNIEAE
ncbi:hypothetical protein TVAG_209000 [Trichomonas vaginalis G3]|uniref:Uncharacterized protein n=1 Tax=Trichomonas vaginalis (strain ATCC PRA-98 / G3) TaxID=412133 RepID=A2DVE2_TRIV3|nr:hypothetical protein TVAG_209000 [Trichomonas vaginalis G3]|eukprot:XP_001327844.1 hypothetical protein [Trichomonas vaginalis G3]